VALSAADGTRPNGLTGHCIDPLKAKGRMVAGVLASLAELQPRMAPGSGVPMRMALSRHPSGPAFQA
jgi:hypothetical protein